MKLRPRLHAAFALTALLFFAAPARAQDPAADRVITETVAADTTYTRPQSTATPTTTQWDQKTSSDAYSYRTIHEYVPVPREPEHEDRPQQRPQHNSGFLSSLIGGIVRFFATTAGLVLLIGGFAAVIILLIYRMVAGDGAVFSRRNRKIVTSDAQQADDEQNLLETHWERLLREAMQQDDKRLAIRYSYMWLLQLLQERSMIQYRQDKTNITYYHELAETPYGKPFRQLMRQYEYAWYGHFLPTDTDYETQMALFADLKKALQR